MVFECTLCCKETCYVARFCKSCQRIKHYLNLYDERVYEVLDSVLSRELDKQNNKINAEIKKEIEIKTNKLN